MFYLPFRLIDLKVRDFARALAPQLFITLIMSLICLLWLNFQSILRIQAPWTRLLSTSLLGAIVYVGIMIVFRPPVMEVFDEIATGLNQPLAAKVVQYLRRCAWRRAGRPAEFHA
jgi:hypothetical protein